MAKKESGKTADLSGYKQSVILTVDGQSVVGDIRQFSSGSIGYNFSGKLVIDGKKCQLSGNAVVIGTKPEKPAK